MTRSAAVLAALCLSATSAAAFEVPGCDGLAAWGATAGGEHPMNAEVALPPAYAPEASAAAFGLPFLEWTRVEVDAIDDALNACRRAASSARDRDAADAFNAQRRGLGQMSRVLRDIGGARESLEKARAGIADGPQTPQLLADLQALAATDPASLKGFRSQLRDVGLLARALLPLPAGEQRAVLDEVAALAGGLGSGMADARLAEIAAAPATAEGILALRASGLAARAELGDGAAPVLAAAGAREAEIAAALAAQPTPPLALPGCAELLDWGRSVDLRETRRLPAGRVNVALEAPSFAAVFGKGFAEWTAEDVALFAALAQQCTDAARAGLLEGDARTLEREARALADLARAAADQPQVFAAMAAGRARAAGLIAEAEAAGGDGAGLDALQAILARIGNDLEPAEAEAVRAAVAARRQAVGEAILAAQAAAMEAAPATLAGLKAIRESLLGFANTRLWWQLTDLERAQLISDAEMAQATRAEAALPEFEAALAALPASFEGLDQLGALAESTIPNDGSVWAGWHAAVDARRDAIVPVAVETGLPELEAVWDTVPQSPDGYAGLLAQTAEIAHMAATRHPAFGQVAERSAAKAAAMRAALTEARCAPVLAEAGLGRDDATLVLAGGEPVPLAAFLCDVAGKTAEPVVYEAPGFFGAEHRITLMLPEGWQGSFVLRAAEVRPGVEALVGIRAEEPSGARDLGTAEWSEAASWLSGVGACRFEAEAAAATAGGSPEWVRLAHCLLDNPTARAPAPAAG